MEEFDRPMERLKVYSKCWDWVEAREPGEVKIYTKEEIKQYKKEKE